MWQMKSPVGLRVWLIYQVRAAGGVGCCLGFACYQLTLPKHCQSWCLSAVPWVLGFILACVEPLYLCNWWFSSEVTGLEDGGVKASPVPSDPEKPGTPAEGMLSSDLDRIPTEGEACMRSSVEGSSMGKEGPVCGPDLVILVGHDHV